ncbi:MAG: HAD family hydrolase [Microbispora sp.]|nr:HAD family hydrolase [Microbispora sp.]
MRAVAEPSPTVTEIPCDLVVFDLDGTIFDTHTAMEHAFRAAFLKARPDCRAVPIEDLRRHQGRPFPEISRELGWPSELPELFIQESRKRIHDVRVFAEALHLIRFLAEAGVTLAVLTGKDRVRATELLRHFGLSHHFPLLVCGDDPFAGKPNPEGLRHLIEVTGSRAAATYYIGDAPLDRRCAREAGVNFLGVEWPSQPKLLRQERGYRPFTDSGDIIRVLRGRR